MLRLRWLFPTGTLLWQAASDAGAREKAVGARFGTSPPHAERGG